MLKSWLVAAPALCVSVLLTSCSNVNQKNMTGTPPSASASSLLFVASGDEPIMPQPNLTGYSIAPNGALSWLQCAPIANSPLLNLVGHGSQLFTTDGDSISVYSVGQSGCLTLKSVTKEDLNTDLSGCYSNCFADGPLVLYLEPTDQNLYSWNYAAVDASQFVSYRVNPSTDAVTRTSNADAGYPAEPAGMLAFSSGGSYAVSATYPSYPSSTGIRVYRRASDGTLQFLNGAQLPAVDQGDTFTPTGAAGDSANHYIIAGELEKSPPEGHAISWALAIYTMDSSGNLTTQSSAQTMQAPPSVQPDGELIGYAFSPDGRYFAIGGTIGIDVYRWDSASVTLTFIATIQSPQPCTPNAPCAIFHNFIWDRYGHIIATWGQWVDPDAQIQVYNVSASGITAAPGSPYPLPSANMLTVVDGN